MGDVRTADAEWSLGAHQCVAVDGMQNDSAHDSAHGREETRDPEEASQPLRVFKTELSLRLEVTHVLRKKRGGSSELKETLETRRKVTTRPSL